MSEVTEKELEKLRKAIKRDERIAALSEKNEKYLQKLYKRENYLSDALKLIQTKIVKRLEKKYDVTDSLALDAARETLKVLEERLKESS